MLALLSMAGPLLLGLAPAPLPTLNIDARSVVVAGFDHSADFAHQFHVAFSRTVSGACLFAPQPFNCAITSFPQDVHVPLTADTRVPVCSGCPANMTLPFDHCKLRPGAVDVGSLVDYPRRHCGQNPVSIQECFDDVDFLKPSRVFLFRGTRDERCKAGAAENVVGLLAQASRAQPLHTVTYCYIPLHAVACRHMPLHTLQLAQASRARRPRESAA